MDQLIDSRLERQAQATSKQHYLHRDLQGGRAAATGSHLTDKGRTKLDERGLRYVLHHDEMEQKLLEVPPPLLPLLCKRSVKEAIFNR